MISERAGIPISRPTSGPASSVWGQLGYGQPGEPFTFVLGSLHQPGRLWVDE